MVTHAVLGRAKTRHVGGRFLTLNNRSGTDAKLKTMYNMQPIGREILPGTVLPEDQVT